MRVSLLSAAIFAAGFLAPPATAQQNARDVLRQYNLQAGGDKLAARERNDWRQYRNYDYDRFEPGERGYHADRYYRRGRQYHPQSLGRDDRVYRGGDDKYYCRRSDGTTGLIVGGLTGGGLGDLLARGGSRPLGALIGTSGEAQLGRSVDRGEVICR